MCSSELTDLGLDSPPVSHLFSFLNESLSLKACQCPQLHPGADDRMTSTDVLRHRWDKTWKISSPCLRQTVHPAPVGSFYYPSPICPSPDENPQSFSYSLCSGVSMSLGICAHSLEARGTLPTNSEGGKRILGSKAIQFLLD